jgi:hypothetical protein
MARLSCAYSGSRKEQFRDDRAYGHTLSGGLNLYSLSFNRVGGPDDVSQFPLLCVM